MKLGLGRLRIAFYTIVLFLCSNTILASHAEAAYVGSSTDAVLQQMKIVKRNNLPQGFVYLDEVIPSAQYEIRYYGDNNFVGKRIDGYRAPLAIFSVLEQWL